MLRSFQPDLLCALLGFALGAAALVAHASMSTPPSAPAPADIPAQTAPATPTDP